MLGQAICWSSIRIPGTFAGKTFYFEKVRDRQVWDFALVNVASAMSGAGTIEDTRIVVNGVAARPLRLVDVEAPSAAARATRRRRRWRPRSRRAAPVHAAAQRLQGPADAESREARHSGSG